MVLTKSIPQTYTGDPRTCDIFIPAWGSNWGSLGFSHNQNNRGLSGVYVTCIYCGLSVKMLHGAQRLWTHLYCVCFCVHVGKNQKTPNLSPMADDAITRGDIGGLGSPVYICGLYTVQHKDKTKLPRRPTCGTRNVIYSSSVSHYRFPQ